MRIGDLAESAIERGLRDAGIAIDFGPARVRVRADVPGFGAALRVLYAGFPAGSPAGFFDITATLVRAGGLRRHFRPQVDFVVDGERPFEPFPADTHVPLFEWGVNFCVAHRCNHYLLLHAGAVAQHDAAVLLPALPGAGKSTLTAALALRGFRLLSDEFGVLRPSDGAILPAPRPVALKNESIEVIRRFSHDAVLGPTFPKTRKGTVSHLAPDVESIARRHESAQPRVIVFPRFSPGAALQVDPLMRSRAFAKLSTNSFNYELLGPVAFEAVVRLVRQCDCYNLVYGDLESAVDAIRALLADRCAGSRAGAAARPLPH